MRLRPTVVSLLAAGLAAVAACHPGGVRRPPQVTPVSVALGDSLFNTGACQRCHGKGGVGAQNAPALDGKRWLQLKTGSYDEIVKIITEGVPQTAIKDPAHRFAMRGRGGPMNLNDAQVQAVAAYVWTLSHK
ncbi:MAG TPA: cytochrome c [Gemmatimonadaceae bacterium]|jgi:mono/diheme cytochrome c family protein